MFKMLLLLFIFLRVSYVFLDVCFMCECLEESERTMEMLVAAVTM